MFTISVMDTYYSRLNAVRAKHQLAAIPKQTLTAGTRLMSTQITKVKTDIEKTTTDAPMIPDKTFTITNIAVGNKIMGSTHTQINTALAELETYCYNHSNCGDDSDYYNNSNDNNHYSDDWVYGTCGGDR